MRFRDPVGAHRDAGIPVLGTAWRDRRVRGENLADVVFQDCTFERVHFEDTSLEQALFLGSRFDDCIFERCRLVETRWIDCRGTGFCVFAGVLSGVALSQCRLSLIDVQQRGQGLILAESGIDRLILAGAGKVQDRLTVSGCTFGAVEMESALWSSASAVEVDLGSWSLAASRFEQCSFVRAIGNNMDFSTVEFESCNLYKSAFRKARFRHAQRTIFAECDLTEADLGDGRFAGALFAGTNAPGARFERADLEGALFPKAILSSADFAGALARRSIWSEADLSGANLEGMDAFRAIFRNAVLHEAHVANARFAETDLHGVEASLEDADLTDARRTVSWRAELEAEARPAGSGAR